MNEPILELTKRFCPCRASVFIIPYVNVPRWLVSGEFCHRCGARLYQDGTTGPPASELERKAAVVDGLFAGKTICELCANVNYCMDPATAGDISCDRGNGFKLTEVI